MEVVTEKFSSKSCFLICDNNIKESTVFPKEYCACCWKVKFNPSPVNMCLLLECLPNSQLGEIRAICDITLFFSDARHLSIKNRIKKFSNEKKEHELIGGIGWLEISENTTVDVKVDIEARITKPKQWPFGTVDHKSLLENEVGSGFDDSKHSDVVICVGETNLKAHRQILMARSAVFAAMLEHDLLEKKSGRITISDFDSDVVQSFLRYVYSGLLEIPTFEMASNLLRMADKYDVEGLKFLSCEYFANVINETNCMAILLLGEMHNAPDLKKLAVDFFLRLPNSVVESMSFQEIEKNQPSLLTELLKGMSRVCSDVCSLGSV